ncbi:D-erythro-7,8-dihydroneopterin triphosphate epimerase [Halospina denitrificans]|uniref:Dihydroneopterin triphosphate 2'-epimerase n=1 Tax=Halospina denitrificans TaxID=332522 RepID=A0A4R7JZQ2_9GAMM|nr:dihydroneopterin triphosphate 2'-epimerase [Halospina denitrificans]TDT44030.1 D-erythro-7,8-dihydroneopterin triphosphate epimerase [Halospina denitrificans]
MARTRTATIRIKNLRLRTYVGIKEEEVNNRQDVVVNVRLVYDAGRAIQDNDIEAALNYRTITKNIIAYVEDNRFALLERMTREVLGIAMEPQAVLEAEVEIDKPHALRFSDSVSVTLSDRRGED